VLFSEPKIPQSFEDEKGRRTLWLSVLFSEPKIPQSRCGSRDRPPRRAFSALQRAENSSIERRRWRRAVNVSFQCSSASRKFLNPGCWAASSICFNFQCSSASRKFLNPTRRRSTSSDRDFQCSSASRKFLNYHGPGVYSYWYDFQCSSASRKFLNRLAR